VRTLRWTFILFQFVWLNIVTPGHIRGLVTVGNEARSESAKSSTHGCCHADGPADSSDSSKAPAPTDEQKRNCAVCFFAAGLTLPPVFVFEHSLQGEVGRVAIPAPEQIVVRQHAPAFHGRAPPQSPVI
jgi:hypothetical protein